MVGDDSLTFGALHRRVGLLASVCRSMGVGAGDVVAQCLPNCLDALVLHLAAAWLNAVSLPLGSMLGRKELAQALVDPRVKLVAIHEDARGDDPVREIATSRDLPLLSTGRSMLRQEQNAEESPALEPLDPSAPAVLIYTSGTTSRPKGVKHSEARLMFDARSIVEGDGLASDEATFVPSSISHISGVVFLLYMPFVQGNTVCTLSKWNAGHAIALMLRERCTWAAGAPTFLQSTVDAANQGSESALRLRVFRCGGADVPPSLIREARAMGILAYRSYGLSEFPTVTGYAGDSATAASRTDGRVHRHISVRIAGQTGDAPIAQEGEILLKGPEMFIGYVEPAATADAVDSDGWLHTGDLGRIDKDRFLNISGRIKDIIIRKGENISPWEVEEMISAHPAVLDVAVLGTPDAERGQMAVAAVVLRSGEVLDLRRLRQHLEQCGLARFKWPERVLEVDELPRTGSGKVRRNALREMLGI